ncbi:MAG: hypothetical protein PVF76_04575 [Syntrophobacterales bacterium]|jgi:hypothetical protein
MPLYSEAELDLKAKATVLSIDRNLESHHAVKNICNTYVEFCKSPKARKKSIRSRKITEGIELRLLFEILCFTSFLTFKIVPKYVFTRKLVRKKANYELVNYFNNQVAKYLFKLCQNQGMTKLQEIVLMSSPPEIKIRFGDPLHPVKRVIEYSKSREKKSGIEIKQLAEHISKALDPYHYPEFEGLWNPHGKILAKIANKVMNEVFTPSVKLKT